jgi:hypothetical protein
MMELMERYPRIARNALLAWADRSPIILRFHNPWP